MEAEGRNARIVVLTTTYPSHADDWSGAFIAKLMKAMRALGYPVTVVAPATDEFHGRKFLEGIETIRFGYFIPRSLECLTGREGGIPENLAESVLAKFQLLPMMLVFLIRTIFELKPSDILYANWIGAGLVGAVANLLRGNPLVVSFRGDDGYLARDKLLWRWAARWIISRADALAPVSKELLEIMVSLGAHRERCFLPRFGVDSEMFQPMSSRPPSDSLNILFVGSLIPKKGVQDLLDALSVPEFHGVYLTVIGGGFYEGFLKKSCRSLGISDRTRWRGVLKPVDVASAMRESDILCVPSHTEGSPNVVKEAMASGLPVVASRVGGIPDLVQEGVTGLLHEPGDVQGLRMCLVKLAASRDLREKFGKAARKFVMESAFSWGSAAEDFDKLFKMVAPESQNHSSNR